MPIVVGGLGLPEEGSLVAGGLGVSEPTPPGAIYAALSGSASVTATLTAAPPSAGRTRRGGAVRAKPGSRVRKRPSVLHIEYDSISPDAALVNFVEVDEPMQPTEIPVFMHEWDAADDELVLMLC